VKGKDDERHITKIRNFNRYRILKHLYLHGKTSRANLARILHLSPPTISRNVKPYIDGLIHESGKMPTKSGRRPDLLIFNYSYRKVLSIQVDRDFMCAGVGDLSGRLLDFYKVDKSMYMFSDFQKELRIILERVKDRSDIAAVVFGISGYVLPNGSFHISVCNWEGLKVDIVVKQVKEIFEDALVIFENDANLFAFRELHLSKKTFKHLVCIYWGRGIGMGLVLDGSLYVGRGMAGEIGMCLQNSKTLEEYLMKSIEVNAGKEEVARTLFNLSRIFDPEAIVLNGRFEAFFDDLQTIWSKKYDDPCKLMISEGGERAIVEGGVCLGSEMFLKNVTTGVKTDEKLWR